MLLRYAVPAPDSMAVTHPTTGLVFLRGIERHPLRLELLEGYRQHTLVGQRQLERVRGAYPGVVWYALARLELTKGAPAASVEALLARARTGGGIAPGVVDLLEARLRFREGDSVAAWQAWERMLTDPASVTDEVAWALLQSHFVPALLAAWSGLPAGERLRGLSGSLLHRRLIRVYLGQAPGWIPMEAYARGYVLFRQGAPLLVGVFALPRRQLVWEDPGPADEATVRVFYPVEIEIAVAQRAAGEIAKRTTSYRIPSRLPSSDWEFIGSRSDSFVQQRRSLAEQRAGSMRDCGPSIRGFLGGGVIPCGPTQARPDSQAVGLVVQQGLAPGQPSVVTVALRQAGGGGTIQTFLPRRVPVETDTLFASDLVLGWPQHGYTWRSMERLVPMHPTGVYPVGAELSLFAQVRGLEPDTLYQVTVEIVAGEVARPTETVLLTLRMTEEAATRAVEWYRQVRLGELKAGGYRVRVTFRQGERVVVREDWMRIVG